MSNVKGSQLRACRTRVSSIQMGGHGASSSSAAAAAVGVGWCRVEGVGRVVMGSQVGRLPPAIVGPGGGSRSECRRECRCRCGSEWRAGDAMSDN